MELNHLHVNVPDVKAAQLFYEQYFNFKLLFLDRDGVFLGDGKGFLLALDPLKPDEPPPEFPAWFHFGFCVSGPEAVKALFQRMKSDGVKFARELREFGVDAVNFYCWAPGGYKLEVSWNKQ